MGDRQESIRIDEDVIKGLIQANAPPEVIEAARRNSEGSDFQGCEVWEENWQSLLFFLAIDTQWIVAPMGGYIGLNYQSVKSLMWIQSVKKKRRKEIFADLQIIEKTILKIQAERRNK